MMKRLILIVLAFNLLSWVANAVNRDGETRTATVSVKVSGADEINIKAKYTDLVVETWEKNEVEVIATIRFDGKMTDKMREFLDNFQKNVEDNIQLSNGELLIDTNLEEPNKIQIGSRNVGIIIGFSESELKLDYKIKAPATNIYDITSAYRDVKLIGGFKTMKIEQYSGDIIGELIEDANLNLKYGSASFRQINRAQMEIYEQELEVRDMGKLEINTKYSDLELNELGSMIAESYESDFIIGTAKSISGNYKYGEIEIKELLEEAELTLYEMDVEAKSVGLMKMVNTKYCKIKGDVLGAITFLESYEDETKFGKVGSFRSMDSKYGNHSISLLEHSFELNAYEDDVNIDDVAPGAEKMFIGGKYINAHLGVNDSSFKLYGKVKYGEVDYEEALVNIKKHIKDSDELELELESKKRSENPLLIKIEGYEIDLYIK